MIHIFKHVGCVFGLVTLGNKGLNALKTPKIIYHNRYTNKTIFPFTGGVNPWHVFCMYFFRLLFPFTSEDNSYCERLLLQAVFSSPCDFDRLRVAKRNPNRLKISGFR